MSIPVRAPAALPARSWLGLLGGGQLGRMFTQAAQAMGYRVCVLDPDAHGPAAMLADRHIAASYADQAALAELADCSEAITTEFENVPAASLEFLAARKPVCPDAASVAIAQDRITEKAFVRKCGVATVPYREIRRMADLDVVEPTLFPGILKAARLGYDGKGQERVADIAQSKAAFARMGEVECVLEKQVDLDCEVSVLIARSLDGATALWPIARNVHRGGILHTSAVPAGIAAEHSRRAIDAATEIASRMHYVGVLCIEFFMLRDGTLCVNEMAPRPHNSGHWTIDASLTSQFEQQARILARMPLGDTRALSPAVMLNLLGDLWMAPGTGDAVREPDWQAVLRAIPNAKLHLSGKAEARLGRKMGHLTFVADDVAAAASDCAKAARILGLAP
ncbi:MAG: 5-(carboxyamino)imidazole ribonucleotide synthase [Betaproteobacteria bacterium]